MLNKRKEWFIVAQDRYQWQTVWTRWWNVWTS